MFGAPHAPKLWDFWVVTVFGVPQRHETPQCSKNPKVLGHEVHKPCNARKIPKMPKFRDLWPSSLHSLQKFGSFGMLRAVQCLVHLMPQNFGIVGSLQCLVYLRATKHRNARKIPKFWGMRCTNPVMLERSPKMPKFRDLWPSSLHSLQKFGIFGIFRAVQCLVHLMPQNFGIFRAFQYFAYLRVFYYSITL